MADDASENSPEETSRLVDDLDVELAKRLADHEEVRAGQHYQAESKRFSRLVNDFVLALRASVLAFSRYPHASKWLLQANADEFLESAVSIAVLGREGVFNVGFRELRYMLEAGTKYVWVDQQIPGDAPLAERIAVVSDRQRVPRSSVELIDDVTIRMLRDSETFKASVKSTYGALSGYVHVSPSQLQQRVDRALRGEHSGFEGSRTLQMFNRIVSQTFDLVLTLVLEGIGPQFAGDVVVGVLDPDWKFRNTRYVGELSDFFSYKHELREDEQ